MLRAYAAWAEGTAEVDIEAIKRSMNASEAPPAINLAVDLSVAEALQTRHALTARPERTTQSCPSRLFRLGELAGSSDAEKVAGVAGFEPTNGRRTYEWQDQNRNKPLRISKLLTFRNLVSPRIPLIPHGCHQSCH